MLNNYRKDFKGINFNAQILESPLEDNEEILIDFRSCIEIIREFYQLANEEIIVIGIYILDHNPINKIQYFPFDEKGTLLNTLICTNLQEFLIQDIKTVLNNPQPYFNFIQSELPQLIIMSNMIFHNYKTIDDVSKILTPNMTYINLGECESLLKITNGIPQQDPLILYVIDFFPCLPLLPMMLSIMYSV